MEFDHIGSGLIARGELAGFEIAGSDGVYFPANAEIKNDKVHVHSDRVEKPKNVRYGWKNYLKQLYSTLRSSRIFFQFR